MGLKNVYEEEQIEWERNESNSRWVQWKTQSDAIIVYKDIKTLGRIHDKEW